MKAAPTSEVSGRPLWSILTSREEFATADLPLLTVISEYGVRERDLTEGRSPSADLSGYRVVCEGDLVVNRLWARFGAYGVSAHYGIISPAYWVLRIDHERYEPRYLHYLLRSAPYRGEIWRRSKDQPPNGFDLPWDQFRSIRVPTLELSPQRAIADYLDRETPRIDALIAARRRMIELLEERLDASIEARINELSAAVGMIPLKFVADDVSVGIVVTPSEWYAESGVPALRGLNVGEGYVDLDDLIYISDEGHRLHRKSELRAGDVVTVRTGQAGTTAVIPPALAGANCIDLLITRPGRRIIPEFLELVFNSDWVRKHVEENSVGAIQSHFNVDALKNLPVPSAPVESQRSTAAELLSERAANQHWMDLLRRQIDLLAERRQSLITAAVTGGIGIPVVAA